MTSKEELSSFSYAKENWLKVGQLVKPADGSDYLGKITYVDFITDTIEHTCQKTGKVYAKSVFGMFSRYIPID